MKIVVPETAGQPTALFEKVVEAAVESDRMRVASALGLAALLLRRADLQDKADVVALIKTGRMAVSDFPLSSLKKSVCTGRWSPRRRPSPSTADAGCLRPIAVWP